MMAHPTRALIFPVLWPLATSAPAARRPWATLALIGLNALAFLLAWVAPEPMMRLFALWPEREQTWQFLTYSILHDASWVGLAHLIVNLYFFWVFARPIEERLGPWRLGILYALLAAAGALAHTLFQGKTGAPLIGASAVDCGLIGASLILFPSAIVRCFFCVLIVVYPVAARVVKVPILAFMLLYWALTMLVGLVAVALNPQTLTVAPAAAAHLGGMVAGAMLAAIFYGTGAAPQKTASVPAATSDPAASLADWLTPDPENENLTIDVNPVPPAAAAPARPAPDGPIPPKLRPLYEHVMMGRVEQACQAFAALAAVDETACLPAVHQLDLARILIRAAHHELAIEALERLLRCQPDHEVRARAQIDLARLLITNQRDVTRAVDLLSDCLQAGPPTTLEHEALGLLDRIAQMRGPLPQGPLRYSDLDAAAAAGGEDTSQVLRRAKDLFEDTGVTEGAAPKFTPHAPGRPTTRLFTPDDLQPETTGQKIKLDLDETGPASAPKGPPAADEPAHPSRLMPATKAAPIEEDDPTTRRRPRAREAHAHSFQDMSARSAEAPARDASTASEIVFQGELMSKIVLTDLPESSEIEFKPLSDTTSGVRSAEPAEAPAQPEEASLHPLNDPIDFGLERSDDTRSRSQSLRDATPWPDLAQARYAVILAPSEPMNVPVLLDVISPIFKLSPKATHHALLRRRGILLEHLDVTEAEAVARQLALTGQSVALVARTARIEFGDPHDLLSIKNDGERATFRTYANVFTYRWSEAVLIGTGMVIEEPQSPPRAVLDLFFANPNRHLRIWENTFLFNRQGEMPAERRFRALAWELTEKTLRAVQTRTLEKWLAHDGTAHPEHLFYSTIEYDNYLRWHLMAYLAPSKILPATAAT